ncbi:MAG: toll/interleukin-1 receptor domain-containing protein [Lachnospiraceae bacterium]|nr:toll/interleukin-1 receptor domain-containing protein [Lachnospiraceae bacterium]
MKTEALNCRCCGGVLNVQSALAVCEYCGATNFVSDTAGKYINQLNRANKLRQQKEYDNAIRIYDNILSENIPSADILWLRTLCEYGIEYVPDPISTKYFPTLHRVKDESILNYYSYLDALKLCDEQQKEILVKEATEINRIQTEYLEIAKNEAPYDVFICYKETDEDTKKTTEDVAYCTRLYEILTKSGYKVFFARETLQNKLSVDYEPYIFAALKSSKVMAVIGSKSEYFTATWVKNEWSRFLKLMEKDSSKQIFFACDDPEELPRAFSLKQAQLLSNPNAMEILAQNIINYLVNIIKAGKNGVPGASKKNMPVNWDTPEGMLLRAKQHLSQKNYAAVYSNISDLLEMNPATAEAYWIRLLANVRHNEDNIIYAKVDLTKDDDYDLLMTYATSSLKEKVEKIKDTCLENIRLQEEFNTHMDAVADEFRSTVLRSKTYAKKDIIVKELEDLKKDYDNFILSKISGTKILQEISRKVAELDTVYKTILDSMSSRSITEYRKFCEEKGISNLVELDMASEKMKALRKEYTEENKALRAKYLVSEELYNLNEEILSRKDAQAKKQARMNVIEETLHEFDSIPSNFAERMVNKFLDD